MLPRLVILAMVASRVIAASSHPQVPLSALPSPEVDAASGLTKDMVGLLDKYSPVILLSSKEQYYPSSVEYMMRHYTQVEDREGNIVKTNLTRYNSTNLGDLPAFGQALFLDIDVPHNPQPELTDPKSAFLHGPGGADGSGLERNKAGRKVVHEPVYGFWVGKGDGIVDLFYWTFYPFNLGKNVGPPFGVLGNHVSDWEHLRVRTINGTAVSADYVTHREDLGLGSGTVRWQDVEKYDSRPIAYSAAGSHGLWPTPGPHIYAQLANLFKLVDETDTDGARWDTKGHVVPIQYWHDPQVMWRKRRHVGEMSWLNFLGLWGNRGDRDCWWRPLLRYCQLVDAPWGPNRDFRGPPTCIIAPLQPPEQVLSTYSFKLDHSAILWARNENLTHVSVEQTCRRERASDLATGERQYDEFRVGKQREELRDDANFTYELTTPPCGAYRGSVASYRVLLCNAEGECRSRSRQRTLCTYEEGQDGFALGRAVEAHDVDPWRWRY